MIFFNIVNFISLKSFDITFFKNLFSTIFFNFFFLNDIYKIDVPNRKMSKSCYSAFIFFLFQLYYFF